MYGDPPADGQLDREVGEEGRGQGKESIGRDHANPLILASC